MARFDSAVALALRLITRNGEESIIVRKTDGTPVDATKPWIPGAPTDAQVPVKAVWLNQSVLRQDSSILPEGHMSVIVAHSGLTITPDPATDRIVRASGEAWTIVTVETLNPNGQQIIHELTVVN